MLASPGLDQDEAQLVIILSAITNAAYTQFTSNVVGQSFTNIFSTPPQQTGEKKKSNSILPDQKHIPKKKGQA